MEPNNMAFGASGVQNQPIAPTGPDAIEQALAEANVEVASAAGVPMGSPAKKSGHGMLIGLILCILLAAGGIGFGVWAMMDGNTQKTNLEKQISSLQAQNSQLLEQIAELEGLINNSQDATPTENNYVSVEEWGIMIKIGSDLEVISIDLTSNEAFDQVYIRAVGTDLADVVTNMDASLIGDIPGNFVARSNKSTLDPFSNGIELMPIYNDGEYNYFVYQPSGFVLEGLEQYADQIVDAFEEVAGCLEDSENYSTM